MSSVGDEMAVGSKRAAKLRAAVDKLSRSRHFRKYLGRPYLRVNLWIWNHLPGFLTCSRLGWMYGAHLHKLVQMRLTRRQSTGTFFFEIARELNS